jgi:hypothetical protein
MSAGSLGALPRSNHNSCSCVLHHISQHIVLHLTYWDTGKCTSKRSIVVVAASTLLQLAQVFRCRGEAPPLLRPTEFLPGQYLGL